jgi:hypothetical protein
MKFCSECGQQLAASTEKFCPNCGLDLMKGGVKKDLLENNNRQNQSIKIDNTKGDVMGVGFSGSGNIIGKNIVVGSGTINVSQQELAKIPDSEYGKALKEFSETINQQLKGRQVPEDQVKSINTSLEELAKEVEDVKPRKGESEINYVKRTNIESKTATVIQRVLNVLPEAAETAATFTPLAPFSRFIGKGVEQIVDAIENRKKL